MPMFRLLWLPAVIGTLLWGAAPRSSGAQSAEEVAHYRITETVSSTTESAALAPRAPQQVTTVMYVALRTRVTGERTDTEVTVDSTRVTARGIDQLLPTAGGATLLLTTRPNQSMAVTFQTASGDRSGLSELVRVMRLIPRQPTAEGVWDTLDLTSAAPQPDKMHLDIRHFTVARDTSLGGAAMRTIVMQGRTMLADSGSMRVGDQRMVSIGAGETAARWYVDTDGRMHSARLDETFRRRITVGAALPEVTLVSTTRLELERRTVR